MKFKYLQAFDKNSKTETDTKLIVSVLTFSKLKKKMVALCEVGQHVGSGLSMELIGIEVCDL